MNTQIEQAQVALVQEAVREQAGVRRFLRDLAAENASDDVAEEGLPTRYTAFTWKPLVEIATLAAWKRTGESIDYETLYRFTDIALRTAMPDRAPEDR